MAEFYLPYHFIPVVPREHAGNLDVAEFRKGKDGKVDGVRHDRYEPGTHSGTIECTVEAVSPVFVGHQKTGEEVAGFKLNGQPALPASSLRGLVVSLAEAASNSALRVLSRRVLGQDCYSYRKRMQEPLSAIGMLWREASGWKLEPVCLPLLHYDRQRNSLRPELAKWKRVFPQPVFRVFEGDKESIRRSEDDPADPSKKKWWLRTTSTPGGGVRVRQLAWADVDQIGCAALNWKPDNRPPQTVVAQHKDASAPVQPCLVRVLGCYEKDSNGDALRQIADSKHHELFLPYRKNRFSKLAVPGAVIEKFQQLADQMTEQSKGEHTPRPFEPKDTRPQRSQGERLEPKEGDLVFFDIDPQAQQVTEIAYSSIWRGRVETLNGMAANAWTFFDKVDGELTPFHGKREKVTLAERVFGFVEEKEGEEVKNGLRLKGRVRFSPGLAVRAIKEMAPIPLKELSSPKPPSPALYFRYPKDQNDFIAKSALKPGTHWPQGRKVYLHHPRAIDGNAAPWDNSRGTFVVDRHVKVRPWEKGAAWKFEVRFDNLNDLELGMLLYALSPANEFRHKIGMGKPLGLGSIHVKVERVRVVDRQSRYTAGGWNAERYSADLAWQLLRDSFRRGMSAKIRAAIEELGDPKKLGDFEITYPRVQWQDGEEKLYEWFVSNDQQPEDKRISLQPVAVTNQGKVEARIPTVTRLPRPRRG
jgi:hypothetical protein